MRIKRTTFLKFFLISFLIIVLISFFFLKFSVDETKKVFIEDGRNDVHRICLAFYDTFKELLISGDQERIDKACKGYGKRLGIRITVIARDGTVLGDSIKDPHRMENHITRPEIKAAIKRGEGSSLRYSTTLDRYLIYNAIRITNGNDIIGFLRVSIFLNEINKEVGRLRNEIAKIIVIILLFSCLLSLALSKTLTMPIEDMIGKVERIAKGDFGVRITRLRRGELGELGRNINEMAERLDSLFKEVGREKQVFKEIIDSIPVCICVIALDGRIIMANTALKGLIKGQDIEGKPYWQFFKEPRFNLFIQEFEKEPKDMQQEVIIEGRVFLCSIRFIKDQERAVISLYDISHLKDTERMKKDLVVNVSHELKTPTTTINGYIKTLLEMESDEEKRRFLQIIDRNVERLLNIVNDLLFLSELETAQGLNMEDVDLKGTIRDIYPMFSQKIEQKGLSFSVQIEESARFIKADRFRLEQALINIIDNAVKYTEKGKIMIKAYIEGEEVNIDISDTGPGIPEEHLPRIFERFYVVDKSRSRKTGGTGLGLSIAKHIIEMHKGRITVSSVPKKGTTFHISLPLNA